MKIEPRLSDEIIPDLNNIVRAIEDEGDRCYLSSTNDADRLREIADWLDTRFRRTPPTSQSDEALVTQADREASVKFCLDWGIAGPQGALAALIAQTRASARAEGRREGIEEAAKVAHKASGSMAAYKAIRALKGERT